MNCGISDKTHKSSGKVRKWWNQSRINQKWWTRQCGPKCFKIKVVIFYHVKPSCGAVKEGKECQKRVKLGSKWPQSKLSSDHFGHAGLETKLRMCLGVDWSGNGDWCAQVHWPDKWSNWVKNVYWWIDAWREVLEEEVMTDASHWNPWSVRMNEWTWS